MADYFIHGAITGFIFFQVVLLLNQLGNIIVLHTRRKGSLQKPTPHVSILVPARNEEKSIEACICSLLKQDYPSFEVIVLDDQSDDGTLSVLERVVQAHPKLKVLRGSTPPASMAGKNWACTQLADQAVGDLLFFTDADTVFMPQALRLIVSELYRQEADLLTGFPRQSVHSWGERLLVPFFSWVMLCFVPLWLAYRLKIPLLASAVGQMMIFRREAYQKIGGHASLGIEIVDDLALTHKVKASGLRWRMMRLTDLVSCRMYQGGRQAFEGFSKNLFAAFDYHLAVYLFVYLWLGFVFLEPLGVLAAWMLGYVPEVRLGELAVCIGLSLFLWIIGYAELKIPLYLGLLYPATIVANEAAAFQSLRLSLTGDLSWKGRQLARPRWKWL